MATAQPLCENRYEKLFENKKESDKELVFEAVEKLKAVIKNQY